jgi:hypothetical protein
MTTAGPNLLTKPTDEFGAVLPGDLRQVGLRMQERGPWLREME